MFFYINKIFVYFYFLIIRKIFVAGFFFCFTQTIFRRTTKENNLLSYTQLVFWFFFETQNHFSFRKTSKKEREKKTIFIYICISRLIQVLFFHILVGMMNKSIYINTMLKEVLLMYLRQEKVYDMIELEYNFLQQYDQKKIDHEVY